MKENRFEHAAEAFLFWSRWLMLPFYLGLVAALATLMVVFVKDVVVEAPTLLMSEGETGVVVWVLTLIDLSLAGNLLLMVIFSGYENFVSRMDAANHPDRPGWMGKIDFSGMKLKLIASIVAISAIQLLKAFMAVTEYSPTQLRWLVIIHLTFVVSGVLLAIMDWLSEHSATHHGAHQQ